ncbi:hypothetical protein AVEN_54908-1 [Araneus ventricosus]|uniref:Uncharacterized protein n=1 Tax=Araneus ventricosus TaxID=182803 RepID=A0A4Y2SMR3_ARAVE|nr:hypothetical protein AVEN_5652-1 [Araneus ventricosus]GBN41590.1 hypothetical protein AVEN_113667-1 [Araneus ventricosus]GBN88680.1 hypothetical protein AVEN_54908-1 [Araneus ventricosus]
MWFKLKLNAFLPIVSILVGKDGLLYMKLVEIGILLGKRNPYSYRTCLKHFAVQGKDVLPLEGYDVPHKTMHAHLVTLALAYQLLLDQDVQLAKLLVDRLAKGYARKHGMRKFVLNEGKAPLLECVDETDDKCISVPEWIDSFVRDLELYRREVARSSSESTMGPSTSGLQQSAGKCLEEDGILRRLLLQTRPSEEYVTNTEPSPVDDEPSPMDVAIKTEPMDVTIKTEPSSVPENVTIKTEPLPVDIVIKSEPASDDDIETEPSEEPILEGINSEEPVPEQQSAEETSRKPQLLYAVLNFENITFSSATRVFPEPGDVIVKFQTPPSRVFFVKGEEDGMYWINNHRN